MFKRFLLIVIVLIGLGVLCIPGQITKPPEKDDVIRVDTHLVDVPIAVTDAKGIPVRGLRSADFMVYEDGKKQEIADFATASEPFEVALLLDTSGSTRSDLTLIQRAAQDFIASLHPGDRVAIIAYGTDISGGRAFAVSDILSPLTDDRRALRTAVEFVRTSNGTPYYDSLLQIAAKVFGQPAQEHFRGRRALVVLTDGVDSTSAVDFAAVKRDLGQVGVVSFFIKVDTREFFEQGLLGDCQSATRFSAAQIRRYYKSVLARSNTEKAVNFCQLGDFERLAISKKLYEIADSEMDELAQMSGGRVFPIGDLNEARDAFKSVADEIGTKYSLGYYPTNEKRDGTYRKIRVEIRGLPAGTVVRARDGYTAPSQ
jgi:VWFA-related protein